MKQRSLSIYVVASVVLHLLLLGILVVAAEFSLPEKPEETVAEPAPIQATTVDQSAVDAQVKRLKAREAAKRQAEADRQAAVERKIKEAEAKRQAEEKRLQELAQKNAQQEEQRKKAEAAARAAREKQQAEERRAKKAEAERKRKEQEAKQAAEAAAKAEAKRKAEAAERKRKAEEAKKRAEEQRKMQEELEAEQQRIQARRQQKVASEVDKYKVLIKQTIEQNWNKTSAMQGKSCRLTIRLAKNGFVTSVNQGNGDPIVCQSARAAILKVGTLPVSSDPDVFQQMKEITFTMEPK